MATSIYTTSLPNTTLPSPCESSLTLNPSLDISQQFDAQYLSTYLQSRLAAVKREYEYSTRLGDRTCLLQYTEAATAATAAAAAAASATVAEDESPSKVESNLQQAELTLIYNHHEINIKLTSILGLINSYSCKKVTSEQLTVNHLFLYLFYHQLVLFSSYRQQQIFIGQFNLIHLGKSYKFEYTNNNNNNNNNNARNQTHTDYLLSDLKINQYPKLFLHIRENSMSIGNQKLSLVEIGNFVSRVVNFVDKSNGQVTYVETIKMKLKRSKSSESSTTIKNSRSRSDNEQGNNDNDKGVKRSKIRQEISRVLHRLY
ncbi:hypothetical protein CANMA_004532 [Candida margitis]|uniref:uncharacterized protein n=1 Tax=Candida margitis TaxID=1775924 RepID=UPI0022262B80|nr:uncharacterized protein CANMA_004532 [Candida margitis]KAI5956103.1 hypothetical protein CANMA_004532 [Candida margitis]